MPRSGKITAQQVLEKIEHQEYRCAVTGRVLTPETATLDHIVPIARGGDHCADNIWVVHRHVNAAKGTMTIEEFVALCREVVNHQDRLAGDLPAGFIKEPPAGTGGE